MEPDWESEALIDKPCVHVKWYVHEKWYVHVQWYVHVKWYVQASTAIKRL